MKLISTIFLLLGIALQVHGTSISPFNNLGDMAKASPAVVVAKATKKYTLLKNGITYFRTEFLIETRIKGEISTTFSVQSMRYKTKDYERLVYGEYDFEEGVSYLLFLSPKDDFWRPVMMAHGTFQQHYINGNSYLSPVRDALNFNFSNQRVNGKAVEPFFVYDSKQLIKLLIGVVNDSKAWNSKMAKTAFQPEDFFVKHRAAPSHCTYLVNSNDEGAPPHARWTGFPSQALPVSYHVSGDPGCSDAHTKTQTAITSLNSNYGGVNLTDAGTFTFDSATDCTFTSWIGNNGNSRSIRVLYNDPCNEVEDLNNCSGVLAVGGSYVSSATHTWDGQTWKELLIGYVIVNNGTGTCICSDMNKYTEVMIHELTHTLGIGHIAGTGTANMNPECCSVITPLDVECLDYTYKACEASLLAETTTTNKICDINGWTYYSNSAGQAVFSIQWGTGNDAAKAVAVVTVTKENNVYGETSSEEATYTMSRYWNVDIGSNSISDVSARFYYDAAEKTAVDDAANEFANGNPNANYETGTWFKTNTGAFVPATNVTPSTIEGVTGYSVTSGTENGVAYVQYNNLNSFSGGSYGAGAGAAQSVLPVTLRSFEVRTEANCNTISWETASEVNTEYIELLGSTDGKEWTTVSTQSVRGSKDVGAKYEEKDCDVSLINYYRLRTVDYDGYEELSHIITAKRNYSYDGSLYLEPNPTYSSVSISFSTGVLEQVEIGVYDLFGRKMMSKIVQSELGLNRQELNLQELNKGAYIVSVKGSNYFRTKKVIRL